MTAKELMRWIKDHGVVLESATGPVPNVVSYIAGREVAGNWWKDEDSREIFRLTRAVRDDPDIAVVRLVHDQITFVHKDAWPALVRLADRFPPGALARLEERHTASGKHTIVTTPFPEWIPREVEAKAASITPEDAQRRLGDWVRRG